MTETLVSAVGRYAASHADASGAAPTPIPGLTALRAAAPSELAYAICRPLVAMTLQGRKQVSQGVENFALGPGDCLLVTADAPTVSQVVRASAAEPYISLVLELDPAVIAGLLAEMAALEGEAGPGAPVRAAPTDAETADAALRLMRLLERPASLPVLQAQLVREMHYWLLAGRHGAAIRQLGLPDSRARRVGRAVEALRSEYVRPLRVERLAEAAGMSRSSFHQHFRAVTSLSPLQFQKQLRLIEARRLMLAEGLNASGAAFAVGYESVPQFTREYGRMFGVPPARDARAARRRAAA